MTFEVYLVGQEAGHHFHFEDVRVMNTSILCEMTVGVLVRFDRTGNILFELREEADFELMSNVQQLMRDVVQGFFVLLHLTDFVGVVVLTAVDECLFQSRGQAKVFAE